MQMHFAETDSQNNAKCNLMPQFVVKQPRPGANIEVVLLVNSCQQQQNIICLFIYFKYSFIGKYI